MLQVAAAISMHLGSENKQRLISKAVVGDNLEAEVTPFLFILSRIYVPIASMDREKSENHNDIYFMAFALKGNVPKNCQRKSN